MSPLPAKLFLHPSQILATMMALQLAWLTSIWFTETATNWQKLSLLFAYSVVCGALVWYLPEKSLTQGQPSSSRLPDNVSLSIFALCLGVFFLGMVYASVQVGWPDERHVFAASQAVVEQGIQTFFAGYSTIPWLGIQHPPLVPLIYGGVMSLLGVHLFVLRVISLLLGMGTLLLTYAVGKEMYDHRTGFRATLFLIACPFFFRLGTAAMVDMPATFFFSSWTLPGSPLAAGTDL